MTEPEPPQLAMAPPPPHEAHRDLTDALVGVLLKDTDRELVARLVLLPGEELAGVVLLLEKVRAAGYSEGYRDAQRDMEDETAGP